MNFDWYNTYIILSKELNYRKTAEKLFITTPSVHQQIKNLEHHLQLILFKKSGRNIILTEAGQKFLPIAEKLVITHEDAMKEAMKLKNKHKSFLNIAVSNFIATYLFPDFLPEFFKSAPNIELTVTSIEDRLMLDAVENKEFDVALTRIKPHSKKIKESILCECPIKLVVPNVANEDFPNEIGYFKKYRLLIGNHPGYWKKLLDEVQKITPDIETLSINNVQVTENLILNQQGISYLPINIFNNKSLKNIKIVEPQLIKTDPTQIYTIWTKDTPEIILFNQLFRDFLSTHNSCKRKRL